MKVQSLKFVGLAIIILVLITQVNCRKKRNLDGLSPKEIINTYYKAKDTGDKELLQQTIYFPPDTSEAQKILKAESALTGADEKVVMKAVGAETKAEYEKYLTDDSAEVGVIIASGFPGLKKRIPYDQVVLKKDDGKWKYHYSKWELTLERLTENLKNNPQEASWYYYIGTKIQSENPAKAHRYFKKYYELEPDGFWVCKEFLSKLNKFEDTEKFEKEMLNELPNVPVGNRSTIYLTLGQFYTEHKDYNKAKEYFNKAEEGLKLYPATIDKLQIEKSEEELKLRLEGKYHDILDEIEQINK